MYNSKYIRISFTRRLSNNDDISAHSDGDTTMHTLREGDVFGEMDFFYESEKRRTSDAVSYGYSEIYLLNSEDVLDTFRKYPKFMVNWIF